jgi:hypothetical protein
MTTATATVNNSATAEQKAQFEKLAKTIADRKNLTTWQAQLWLISIGSTPATMF